MGWECGRLELGGEGGRGGSSLCPPFQWQQFRLGRWDRQEGGGWRGGGGGVWKSHHLQRNFWAELTPFLFLIIVSEEEAVLNVVS